MTQLIAACIVGAALCASMTHAATTCATKSDGVMDCSASVEFIPFCYSTFNSDGTLQEGGCVPVLHDSPDTNFSKPDCMPDGVCWCGTDNCNAEELAVEQWKSWASMPRCYGGIAGANHGPSCAETPLYHDSKYEPPDCHSRATSNVCVENNMHAGMGDGCGDHVEYPPGSGTWVRQFTDEGSCTSHRAGERSADDSFDGTTNHCRWIPPMDTAAKTETCEADGECAWYNDRGEWSDGVQQGSCEQSDSANEKEAEWKQKFGEMECEKRTKSGCFENNDHLGENDQCTSNQDGESCLAEAGGDHCQHASSGVCSGDAGCEGRDSEWGCEQEMHQGAHHDTGPFCETTDVYRSNEYELPDCHSRATSNVCVENNMHAGMGDGCGDHVEDPPGSGTWVRQFTDEGSCTSHRAGERSADDSFDGTTNHCRWIPPMDTATKTETCEADGECAWYNDRGEWSDGVQQGSCEQSDSANEKEAAWREQVGLACVKRLRSGCFENNMHVGEGDGCGEHAEDPQQPGTWVKKFADEGSCTSHRAGERSADDSFDGTTNHCRWIPEPANPAETCATHGAGTLGGICSFREAEKPLTCSWEKQCCKWLPPPDDVVQTCATKGGGTVPGMCAYTDGNGPPSEMVVGMGFEHGLFKLGPAMTDKCAMVASFRPGKGSASAFGANAAGLVQGNCARSTPWKGVAEHIGHDEGSIEEYCDNFVPDGSAMAAFENHSPGEIIAAAKSGGFGTIFPGLADNLFIVTSKPEYGECLFTTTVGAFGLAVCTCDGAECNNQEALEYIVNPATGPMRLLRFLDGSLIGFKDAVNAVVEGLLQADGTINPANVAGVTVETVVAIMDLEGMSELTSEDELWGIAQDFQRLNAEPSTTVTDTVTSTTKSSTTVSTSTATATTTTVSTTSLTDTSTTESSTTVSTSTATATTTTVSTTSLTDTSTTESSTTVSTSTATATTVSTSTATATTTTVSTTSLTDTSTTERSTTVATSTATATTTTVSTDGHDGSGGELGMGEDGDGNGDGDGYGDDAPATTSSTTLTAETNSGTSVTPATTVTHTAKTPPVDVSEALAVTLTVPLDVNLALLSLHELAAVKDGLLAAAAEAGGFSAADVERIELVQNGEVIGSVRRRRATNRAITAKIIFKDDATVDVTAAITRMNAAIAGGTLSVTVVIGGEEMTAEASAAEWLNKSFEEATPEETLPNTAGIVGGALGGLLVLGLVLGAVVFVERGKRSNNEDSSNRIQPSPEQPQQRQLSAVSIDNAHYHAAAAADGDAASLPAAEQSDRGSVHSLASTEVPAGPGDVWQQQPVAEEGSVWEPVDMDPNSKSFRMKSVRRSDPLE